MWYRTIGILVGLTTLSLYVRFLLSSPNIHMEVSHHTPSYPSRLPTLSKSLGDVLFPVPPNSANFPWVRGNHLMLQALFHCIERSDCHKNQMKGAHDLQPLKSHVADSMYPLVVLLSSPDFRSELLGHNGGEKIWSAGFLQMVWKTFTIFLGKGKINGTCVMDSRSARFLTWI